MKDDVSVHEYHQSLLPIITVAIPCAFHIRTSAHAVLRHSQLARRQDYYLAAIACRPFLWRHIYSPHFMSGTLVAVIQLFLYMLMRVTDQIATSIVPYLIYIAGAFALSLVVISRSGINAVASHPRLTGDWLQYFFIGSFAIVFGTSSLIIELMSKEMRMRENDGVVQWAYSIPITGLAILDIVYIIGLLICGWRFYGRFCRSFFEFEPVKDPWGQKSAQH